MFWRQCPPYLTSRWYATTEMRYHCTGRRACMSKIRRWDYGSGKIFFFLEHLTANDLSPIVAILETCVLRSGALKCRRSNFANHFRFGQGKRTRIFLEGNTTCKCMGVYSVRGDRLLFTTFVLACALLFVHSSKVTGTSYISQSLLLIHVAYISVSLTVYRKNSVSGMYVYP